MLVGRGAVYESREGYFPVVLLFIRCTDKVVLTFESVGEILCLCPFS